ncbi:MAG: methylenetetrahydrofolate reductase C-terminal domain-containing protein [Bacteroidota bacterium]
MIDTLETATALTQAREICPKCMEHGPCGGVRANGGCEVNEGLHCPYLDVLDDLPWRQPQLSKSQDHRLRPQDEAYSQGKLEATLRAGNFAIIAEVYTPDSADLSQLIAQYTPFKDNITAVNIAEHALATPHASTLAAAALFERAGLETIINLTCRDRNRIGLQGEILGAAALGVPNIFCITGDHPALGDDPTATPVFDLDSLGLIALAKQLRDDGTLLTGRKLTTSPDIFIGAAANPFSTPINLQAERVAAKVAAGANFIQTQGIFDVSGFTTFVEQLRDWGALEYAHLIAGVALVTSSKQARWLQTAVPGARVPNELIERLEHLPESDQRTFGLDYAINLIAELKALDGVSGVLLFPLQGDISSIARLIDILDSLT